ncbi:hypothetical protein DFJ74DRAFT_764643 [Hyaloraphidium curvatum]|nr:hypothetical protein DFJ74DRAFT_764643 [Hyaloraphidium curvatum]
MNHFARELTTTDDRTDVETNSPKKRHRRRRFGAVALRRNGAAALFCAAAAAALAVLLAHPAPTAATSHSDSWDFEVIDPATGFLVCRSTWSGSYGNRGASQCIGWCDRGTGASVGRRRLGVRASQWGFTCGKYDGTESCVRAPSLGCKWIRASASTGPSFNDIEYRFMASCAGPKNGTCSLFSDPFCTVAENGYPVAGGGARCRGKNVELNATQDVPWEESYSFCSEVHNYLLYPKKPESCPDVTETSSNETFHGPWMAIRSCEDKGNYLRIRRAGFRVMCHGPDRSRCSWYTDMGLSILAPGEPAPSDDRGYGARVVGLTCTQTDTGWCKLAADAALHGIPPDYECPGLAPPMPWTCIRSCADKGNYFSVRFSDSSVQCRGPDARRCSWYSDRACTVLAPGEPEPSAEGGGMICPERAGGWCARAAGVFNGEQAADPRCPTDESDAAGGMVVAVADGMTGTRAGSPVARLALTIVLLVATA